MIRSMVAVLFAALLATSAGAAEAASCNIKSLAGLWVGHATAQADLYCLIRFKPNGATSQSSCFNPKTLKPVGSLDGSLVVGADCRVSGNFDLTIYKSGKISPATFQGKMDAAKMLLNGNFVIFGANEDYRFYRQLD